MTAKQMLEEFFRLYKFEDETDAEKADALLGFIWIRGFALEDENSES